MARKSNVAVGVCPCPVSKCSAERAPLFRFATQAASPNTARKAGKFYGRCPTHGWFGYDGAPGMQTYIRENGKLNEGEQWATVESNDASASDSASDQPPEPKPEAKPDSQPAQSSLTPKSQQGASSKSPAALPASTGKPKAAARPNVWDL